MITEKLAKIVVDADYEKLPEDVIYKAKQCFIDFLGVSLGGSRSSSGKIVRSLFSSGKVSTVLGFGKASCTDAPFINGVFAHCLDLDDGHRFSQLHPGCSVIPAALALAEAHDKTGEDLITSIVVGYQISILMGMLVNPEHRNNGFHSTGTCGTFGAAAAASKVLDLEFEETVNALGLAGTQAAGLLESDHSGSMGKHLHAGKSAQTGVISAMLAEKGFTGAPSIIEGREGFMNAMVFPCVSPSLTNLDRRNFEVEMDKIIQDGRYHIMGIYFKIYPVCRHLHSSIDAMADIYYKMKLDGIKVSDISSIKIKTYKIASKHNNYHPKTVEAIRQSLPFATAIYILKGNLNNDFEINSEIISMASKVVIDEDETMTNLYPFKRPCDVTVSTKNKSYNSRIDLPKGEPENPLSQSYLINKFNFINPKIDPNILKSIDKLETYRMRNLMDILNRSFMIEYV
jgi:2-methylcitrate dehydratase PrpD